MKSPTVVIFEDTKHIVADSNESMTMRYAAGKRVVFIFANSMHIVALHDVVVHEYNSRNDKRYPHDDVIKWKHFPRYWPFVRGIHRSPVNSPHKGQWRGALMFSLIYVWIIGRINNREAGDLRRYRAHYDVIVMKRAPRSLLKPQSASLSHRRIFRLKMFSLDIAQRHDRTTPLPDCRPVY